MTLNQLFTVAAQSSLPLYLTFFECQELSTALEAEETLSADLTSLAADLAVWVDTQSKCGGECGSYRFMADQVKAIKAQLY